MFAVILKVLVYVAGIVGVAAQAKARGASNIETIAESATAAAGGAGLLQLNPLKFKASVGK